MRRLSRQTAQQINREFRVWHYRPYILATLGMMGFCMVFALIAVMGDRIQRSEWGSAPVQQGEATCLRTVQYHGRVGIWWANTFRIDHEERTSSDYDGCITGRHYSLSYQIGRSGYMRVNSGHLL